MNLLRKLELPVALLLFVGGSAFLLKMCYLSLTFNTVFGVSFLAAVYGYVRARHDINIPLVLLLLVFAALQVDALGNYFRLYGHAFGPLQYDEFSHLMVLQWDLCGVVIGTLLAHVILRAIQGEAKPLLNQSRV